MRFSFSFVADEYYHIDQWVFALILCVVYVIMSMHVCIPACGCVCVCFCISMWFCLNAPFFNFRFLCFSCNGCSLLFWFTFILYIFNAVLNYAFHSRSFFLVFSLSVIYGNKLNGIYFDFVWILGAQSYRFVRFFC